MQAEPEEKAAADHVAACACGKVAALPARAQAKGCEDRARSPRAAPPIHLTTLMPVCGPHHLAASACEGYFSGLTFVIAVAPCP